MSCEYEPTHPPRVGDGEGGGGVEDGGGKGGGGEGGGGEGGGGEGAIRTTTTCCASAVAPLVGVTPVPLSAAAAED